jgi:hypothetical protein
MIGADIACSINEGCKLVDRCVDIGMTLGTFIYACMYINMNTYILLGLILHAASMRDAS